MLIELQSLLIETQISLEALEKLGKYAAKINLSRFL
jgi:hypothetical protein